MKKLVLTTVCALAMAGAAFAQGNVNWAVPFSAYTSQTNSTQYSPLFGGAATGAGAIGNTISSTTAPLAFYYELLYLGGAQVSAPTTLAGLAAWGDAALGGNNGATAGRVSVVNGTASASVPWAAGVTDNIVLVGWSANLGTAWATVLNELTNSTFATVLAGQNGFIGISSEGYEAANAANPGSTIFGGGASATGFPIQSTLTPLYLLPVAVVPEPTTLALAGLGGLGLMLFRRQRKS
jgi:hypothetical protein